MVSNDTLFRLARVRWATATFGECPKGGPGREAYWPVRGTSWTSHSMMALGSAPCGLVCWPRLATSAFSDPEGCPVAPLALPGSGSVRGAAGRAGGGSGFLGNGGSTIGPDQGAAGTAVVAPCGDIACEPAAPLGGVDGTARGLDGRVSTPMTPGAPAAGSSLTFPDACDSGDDACRGGAEASVAVAETGRGAGSNCVLAT
jgi:hypothetical protein